MCLAIPVKVVSINGDEAEVESGGTSYKASIALTPEAKTGDYVLLHAGYAINVIDREEAEKTLELMKQMDIT